MTKTGIKNRKNISLKEVNQLLEANRIRSLNGSSLIPKKCIAWCTRIEILIFQSPKKHMDLKFLQFLFLFTVRKSEIRICFKLTLRPQSGKNWF